MATYGYARVSTTDQHADRQLTALLASGVERKSIFIDRKSGRNFDRKAAQLCSMSHSTFRERMHRCKADEEDEHNGNIGS